MEGRYVTLAPLDAAAHGESLWDAVRGPEHDELWRYLFDGPYREREAFIAALERKAASEDPLFSAILDRETGRAVGYAAYLRIEPAHRVIEVGSILFTPLLQRTRGATEAMYLMARNVFELGYRRYEWKCDARNEPSRRAAERLGFTFEGIFRQHMIVKGGNRDTAWYSMLDSEWGERRAAFERWLDEGNFDAAGRQRTPLRR
jgi:RimJ/RimL family protein N-acetyltransferase